MHNAESADRRMLLGTVAGAAGIAALAAMSKAGPLNPPAGSVASTGKTLTSVEPRIDLNASVGTSGVSTSASTQFIISSPGSYYLSANVATSKADAILITVSDVTLDLNGFRVSRASGSGGGGVLIGADCVNVVNGSVVGFGDGVAVNSSPYPRGGVIRNICVRNCGTAISAGEGAVVESCTAVDCGHGIIVKRGSVIDRCTVHGATGNYPLLTDFGCVVVGCTVIGGSNASGYGLYAHDGSTVESCAVYGYTGARAISAGRGVALINCSAIQNSAVGIDMGYYSTATNCVASANTGGITASNNCTLDRCVASQNTSGSGIRCESGCTLSGCTANSNGGYGIQLAGGTVTGCNASGNTLSGMYSTDRASLIDCLAQGNSQSGIYVDAAGTIQRCTAATNGLCGIFIGGGGGEVVGNFCQSNGANSTAQGAGIRIQGSRVRIKDNHCYSNWRNIEVLGIGGSVVTGNSCSAPGGGANYSIASGNKVGVIVNCPASGAINGNTGGAGLGSTDPTANFSY